MSVSIVPTEPACVTGGCAMRKDRRQPVFKAWALIIPLKAVEIKQAGVKEQGRKVYLKHYLFIFFRKTSTLA